MYAPARRFSCVRERRRRTRKETGHEELKGRPTTFAVEGNGEELLHYHLCDGLGVGDGTARRRPGRQQVSRHASPAHGPGDCERTNKVGASASRRRRRCERTNKAPTAAVATAGRTLRTNEQSTSTADADPLFVRSQRPRLRNRHPGQRRRRIGRSDERHGTRAAQRAASQCPIDGAAGQAHQPGDRCDGDALGM